MKITVNVSTNAANEAFEAIADELVRRHRAFTAREFVEAYRPELLDLMQKPDCVNAFEEEHRKVTKLARSYGVETQDGRYPAVVWGAVFLD